VTVLLFGGVPFFAALLVDGVLFSFARVFLFVGFGNGVVTIKSGEKIFRARDAFQTVGDFDQETVDRPVDAPDKDNSETHKTCVHRVDAVQAGGSPDGWREVGL
jgi:hypothetical protein